MKAKGPKSGTKLDLKTPSPEQAEFQALMGVMKKLLRERRISYLELAKKLGMSESGVKKIFTGQDLSFRRLGQISQILGFRLADLLDEVGRAELRSVGYSDEQQSYFLKNMDVFKFYFKLVIERQPLEDVQLEFKLSDTIVFKYLKKLDEMDLLRLMPGNQVKLPTMSNVKDFGEGPLLENIYRDWGFTLIRELANPKHQGKGHFIVRCLKMRDETYQEFLTRLLDLEKEFLRRAIREMSVSTKNLRTMRWMSLTDQQSYVRKILD